MNVFPFKGHQKGGKGEGRRMGGEKEGVGGSDQCFLELITGEH